MTSSTPQEPEEISVLGLVQEVKDVHHNMPDRAFAFVLGAGASKSSGIRTAGEMVSDWVKMLHVRSHAQTQSCDAWATAKTLQIPDYEAKDSAAAYSALYARLYRNDPAKGYAYLENEMKNAEPSYGYSVLARILATTPHKVMVTTNFDNLVADSLSIFSNTFPLVCGHESLASFVRARLRRPLVVKVHRDLLLAPKSAPEDLVSLPDSYSAALDQLFKHYTPIVIGYGGNDGSLMGYLAKLSEGTLSGGVYWCYWNGGERPNAEIRHFVARQGGYLVPIPGYDELMVLLGDALKFDVPDKFVLDRAQLRAARIVEQVKTLRERLDRVVAQPVLAEQASVVGVAAEPGSAAFAADEKREAPADVTPGSGIGQTMPAVREALQGIMQRTDGELRWWQWEELAEKESEPSKREKIYEQAVEALPKSPELRGNYANFLWRVRKDHDRAQTLYECVIAADPNDADYLGNYANFLTNVRRDQDRAQTLYEPAIAADPNHADNLGNYARSELQRGRMAHGLELLDRALGLLADAQPSSIQAECWMYAYCCRSAEQQAEALRHLKQLIVTHGVRTGDWDFSGIVARAVEHDHVASVWLPELAEVLAGRADVTQLEGWEDWTNADDRVEAA